MRIVAKNLTYVYNDNSAFATKALEGVTLTVEEGEFFGIIGHTGSGKSTFVQHLNALVPVMEGDLSVGGVNLKRYTRKQYKQIRSAGMTDGICFDNGKKRSYSAYVKAYRAEMKALRARVGMVFQYPEYQLFGETVFEDVAFGLRNFYPEKTKEEVELAVRAAIERVGLNYREVKDKSPFDLSGGQKRRVAIAGVLVTEPQVLVLDEPVAGLDPQGKAELLSLLHSLHGSVCKTVIIVSHDMDDVAENCTRVAVFSGGRLVACEEPSRLFADAERLTSVGLDVPLTASLTSALKQVGVDIESDFKAESFIAAVTKEYRKTR